MLDILYYIFVFPLQEILGFLLSYIYRNLIPSLGGSIILLSIALNIFLLKIVLYTDKKAKEENELKVKLDSRIKDWKSVYSSAKLYAFTKTLYRQNKYHPIYALRALGGLALQIPFFYAMYFVIKDSKILDSASFLWIKDLSKPDLIFGIHLLPILMTVFTLTNVFITAKTLGSKIQGSFICIFFLILLYNMPSALVLYWTTNMLFYLCKDLKDVLVDKYFPNMINKFQIFKFNILISSMHMQYPDKYKFYCKVIILSILNLSMLVFIFSPLGVYTSDLSQFDLRYLTITPLVLFGYFLLSSFIFSYIFSFIFKTHLLKIFVYFFTTLVITSVVYTFILKGNYGYMSYFVFEKAPLRINITATQIIIDTIVCIIAFLISYYLIAKRYAIKCYQILFITLCILSISTLPKIFLYDVGSLNENEYPRKDVNYPLFNFSTKNKNILVIILDRADGYSVQRELKEFKEISSSYDGFINFTNAISTSNSTAPTLSSIIGGEHYTAFNINSANTNEILETKIAKGYANTLNAFYNNGYDVSAYLDFPTNAKYLYPLLTSNDNIEFVSSPYEKAYTLASSLGDSTASERMLLNQLVSFGIFRLSLLSLRPAAYQKGRWLFDTKSISSQTIAPFWAFKEFITNTNDSPTFKFFHFSITHNPYVLGEDCRYRGPLVMTIDDNNHFDLPYGHYYSEVCAFRWISEIINKMKNLNIYDNTEIFITADHGAQYKYLPVKLNLHIPLLYKPYNSRGELRANNNLIANYNIASIFCSNLPDGCPNVGKNVLQANYPREILVANIKNWRLEEQHKNRFILDKHFVIKNNNKDKNSYVVDIYDSSNWTDVTKEFRKQD